ncbi:MAG TPA: histidine phosphatase family protein [Syntrophothermus lipocalidus]|uniref:Phosphoglycerate mutase n=1 Tax=Syntrophothermus lipocalidus (strain DSM 12680 / TGB-C1) TaxID=643648 RepID=D7CND1_SYNLT|nr:histidine phosphatase family protein [Syntrophothermus lipocalidus]ADI02216.1 Phosphoglycerate mutase [Syntrophothermus lipocalidus DSM 12680]HHV75941.1 histidine phosphatase family protein [Syntrophothermus lipocalidus]HOV43300.1 histidine phosphatase family protein [Syntrophothermus lipocalidus]
MLVYLVRHGETIWNEKGRYQGATDVPLSERGIWQATRLASRFRQAPLSAVYSSDLSRAYQTACIIAQPHGLEVGVMPEFREMNFGEWEGLSATEIEEGYGSLYRHWLKDPGTVTVPGGESLESVLTRTLAGLGRLTALHQNDTVLVVTHGGVLMALGCYLNGESFSSFWRYYQGNAAVCSLEFKGGLPVLLSVNDLSHLHEEHGG